MNNGLSDLVAVVIGVVGALLKGLKSKLKMQSIVLGCLIAGILTYCSTGIIEMYFVNASDKIIILVSFSVGWVSNEITAKMDDFIGDVYSVILAYIKTFFKKKP